MDQTLFVGHHAHDRATQEMRDLYGIAIHQYLEFVMPQFKQHAIFKHGGRSAARVVADQQAQFTKELTRPKLLGGKVVAEIQCNRSLQDHEHGGARFTAGEQFFSGRDGACLAHARKKLTLTRRQHGGRRIQGCFICRLPHWLRAGGQR